MIFRIPLSLLLTFSIFISASGQQPTPRPSPEAPKPPASPAQAPPDHDAQDVVRITTNLVQVDAVVTKDGKVVTDLRAEDFEIFKDGKPQTITNFSFISNMPEQPAPAVVAPPKSKDTVAPPVPPAKINPNDQRRIVALVVDDLGMSAVSILDVKKQIKKFLDGLSPTDLVAIIRTGGDVGSLQQFTNDRRLLQNSVDRLKWNQCSRTGLHVFPPAGMEGAYSTCAQPLSVTLRAVRFILRGMDYLPGRKSMVLFSDDLPIENQEHSSLTKSRNQPEQVQETPLGDAPSMPVSTNSYHQLQRLAEIAIRSSVVIYTVDTRGLQTTGLSAADALAAPSAVGPNIAAMTSQVRRIEVARSRALITGREGADLIAKQTGGFLVRNSNDFELNRIMEDQKGYYLLGFRPAEETFDQKFHQIKVRVKGNGLTVRTRAGFYGYTDDQTAQAALTVADQMNTALLSPFGKNDVMVRLTTFFVDEAANGTLLRSFVYVDGGDLTFTEEADGWRVAKVDLRGVLFGDNGKVISQQDQTGTFRVRGAQYQRALSDGLVYAFDLPIKQRGALQFRVAVRDSASSRIGAAGQFVEVPDLRKGDLALSGIFARGLNTGKGATATSPSDPKDDVELLAAGPAVRRFRQGSSVVFAYAIYNAKPGSPGGLTAQLRLFREGKEIFAGSPVPVNTEGQTDLSRIVGASALQLGSDMAPGEYIVQIIVTDSSNKKPRTASQWIDFEIIK